LRSTADLGISACPQILGKFDSCLNVALLASLVTIGEQHDQYTAAFGVVRAHLCAHERVLYPWATRVKRAHCYNAGARKQWNLMPSFDIVSKLDLHELTNAVDQANRELINRFDFKGTGAVYEREDTVVTMKAQAEFQLKQMLDILKQRLASRQIDIRCMEVDDAETNLASAKQKVTLKQGIEQPLAKEIVSMIKGAKLKVEAQINGDKLRVTGKKRDDLQTAIALLRAADLKMPLQYENFRD